MTLRGASLALLLLTPNLTFAQESPGGSSSSGVILPVGTPLPLQIPDHLPMRAGQIIRAELVYPVYVGDKLILPEHTVVKGTVTALRSNRSRRVRAGLGGDFTPFHIPVVRFTEIDLPDGSTLPFASDAVTDGTPIYRAIAPPPSKGGFLHQQYDMGVTMARDDLAIFIAPGKADRLKQFVYGELPYHPERMEKGTSWTIETTAPLLIPPQPAPPPPPVAEATRKRHFWEQPVPEAAPPDDGPGKWTIQAYLDAPLSSETSSNGQIIKATVAEPVYNPDHSIAIPQGATLVGAVTKAKPSHRFGRSGTLSFSFRQLTLPGGTPQNVETTLTGADAGEGLALNSEGQVKSRPQDKISLPAILALAATWSLDQDHEGGGHHRFAKNAAGGGAGLGLVGSIIGLAGASPNAAAGIGYYGAAVAFYYRWIAPGKKIVFPRDTRIVVETIARRSAAMQPDKNR